MHNINLFVEDFGHEVFLGALVRRFAREYNLLIEIKFGSSRGGYGTAIGELRSYIRYLQRSKESLPDLIIAATDANCKGFSERKKQIDEAAKGFSEHTAPAVPLL